MNLPDEIKTIYNITECKYKEKKSNFIGQCYPVDNENTCEDLLKNIRKKYYDATHHCFAYKLSDGQFKYSDDGEPSGTAGIRILNAINHFELTNILVVVIRYFGGTKLGVGPLGKAYFQTAKELLEKSVKITKWRCYHLKIFFPYEFSNQVHKLLSQYSSKIINTFFEPVPEKEFYIKYNEFENFNNTLTQLGYDKVRIEVLNDNLFMDILKK